MSGPVTVTVKVPFAAAGLTATRELASEGIPVNMTLVFSANQALLAAEAGELLELVGCGTSTAAKLIAETAGAERFANDAKLAMHAGAAPLEASSGQQRRHRLNRCGNRQLTCALHRLAVNQGRWHPGARAYLERKQAEGKSRREALRCLKRHLARTVYRLLTSCDPTPAAPEPALVLT